MPSFKAPTLGPFGWLRDKHLPPNLRDGNIQTFLADEAADPASPLAGELSATFVPKWQANTAYLAGAKVLSPSGDVVSAKTGFTSGATYNSANWDLSANLAGKLDKTEAQANYAQLSTLAATFRPATTRQQQPAESIVTTFSSGHTWATSGTGVTWDLNYTGDAFAGSQCVRGTTLGTNVEGSVQSISRTPTIDLTNKVLVMPVKIVSGLANLVSIRVLLSDNNFTANSSVLVFDGNSSTQVIREGEWFNLRFTIADITSSTGTPNLAAVNAIRIAIRDKGTGVAVVEIGKFSYYTPPSATQFPNGAVTLWFDDSYPSHRTIAAPHMAKYGFAGSEAVICDKIDGSNGMTMTQLKELASMYGWEINPHSYTVASHTAGYPSLTEQQLVDEINSIKSWMASHGFGANDHFAYPLGQHSALTDEVLGRYFSTARTTKQLPLETMLAGTRMRTRCVATDNTTTLAAMQAIIDRAFRPGVWLQIYIHDIVADGTANTTTKMETTTFKGIIDYLNTKGCRVMTAGDVWNAGL